MVDFVYQNPSNRRPTRSRKTSGTATTIIINIILIFKQQQTTTNNKQQTTNNNNNNNNHLLRGTIRLHQRVDTPGAGPFSLHGRNSICIHVKETTHTQLSQPDAVRTPSPLTGGIQVQHMAYHMHRHELPIRSVNYLSMFGYPRAHSRLHTRNISHSPLDKMIRYTFEIPFLRRSILLPGLRPAFWSQG